jgi:hypothetical protein
MRENEMTEPSAELAERTNIRDMVVALYQRASEVETGERSSADEFVLDIMEAILAADTVEGIFAAAESGGVSGQDFVNRPFNLAGDGLTFPLSAKQYREAGGFPFFARAIVTDIATGETVTVSCGGKSVVAIFYALELKGFLVGDGQNLVLVERDTESGYSALSVRPYVISSKNSGKNRSA